MTKRFISFGRGMECLFGKYVVYNLLRLVHFELRDANIVAARPLQMDYSDLLNETGLPL
jgi:hypothetical protein